MQRELTAYRRPAPAVSGAAPDHGVAARRLGAVVRYVGVGAALVMVAAQFIAPTWVARVAEPLAVCSVLVGLPHGAVDHLVPFWSCARRVSAEAVALVIAGYVVVAAVAWTAVLMVPLPTLWVFLVVAGLHFGRGEVVVADEFFEPRPMRQWKAGVVTLAYGVVTVGLPLAAWSPASLSLLDGLAPGFGRTPDVVLRALLLATVVLVPLAVAVMVQAGRPRQAAELTLLAVLFTLVPPLAAFAVYFGLWHAARHTLRLVCLPCGVGGIDVRAGAARFLRGAVVPTIVAVAVLVALIELRNRPLVVAQLALLVGLTAPHVGVVAVLDRARPRSD